MNGRSFNSYAAAPSAARVIAYAVVCPWQHGVPVRVADVMGSACASIAFDVLRTVKGDPGSSG